LKTRVDARLREEARRFLLKHRCDDCGHFDPDSARCVHGYPTEEHRRDVESDEIVFCKEFELV
jgi:hypothetical protein